MPRRTRASSSALEGSTASWSSRRAEPRCAWARRSFELGEGRFIGEMSFITGEAPTADVVALDAVKYVSWPKKELTKFLADHPTLRAAWQAVLGADLVNKLRAA